MVAFLNYDINKYDNILDDPNNKLGVFLSSFITFLVVLFAVIYGIESLGYNAEYYQKELFLFDAFISIVFAVEYIYRLGKSKNKISFIVSPVRIIDLFSFIPFFFGLLPIGDLVKILRLFRVLRILRLIKRIPLTAGFLKALKDYVDEYRAVFILFIVILFIGSSFVYFFEKDVVGTKFTSIPMTLRWGLVTMTTVGYGDMYPLTNMGRICGSFLVFLGPIVLALSSAVTIMVFMETANNHELLHQHHKRLKSCYRCKTRNPKMANYCMTCGEEFDL